jgi:hypothetical protein
VATCPEVTQVSINGPNPGPFAVGQAAFLGLTVFDQTPLPLPGAQVVLTSENDGVLFLGGQPYADGSGASIYTDGNGMAQIPMIPAVPGQTTVHVDVLGSLVTNQVTFFVDDVPPAVRADSDGDLDVDGVDFSRFATCFNGAGKIPHIPACNPQEVARFDFDSDGDIDGIDFSNFAGCFNQAGNPPRCP